MNSGDPERARGEAPPPASAPPGGPGAGPAAAPPSEAREAAREARARAAGKDSRHDDDRDEADDTLPLEGEPDDPETATDADDEQAEGGERLQAVRVVHEATPGRPLGEHRR